MLSSGWNVFADILRPSYWLSWLWNTPETQPSSYDDVYHIGRDKCLKCNRFRSWHSKNDSYCSFHNVTWSTAQDKRKSSYQLFRSSYEMWLRSRCGADMDEAIIATNLLTLSSYLDYAATRSQTNGNRYDFCDSSFCDYRMMYGFLLDLRLQAKDGDDVQLTEKHTVDTELRICEALHRFIEFRKFQLPIKGIIENRYSATERLLEDYRATLKLDQRGSVDLKTTAITSDDIKSTITHFTPQYDVIIHYFTQCHDARSMENGCDIEFATSFLCAYLYGAMPEHAPYLHMVRVRDLCLDADAVLEFSGERQTELNQYVSRSCQDLPSPVIASACISKLQQCLALDERVNAVIQAYITFIRPRITKSNDYLLLSSSALGLTAADVQERIVTLVYRVTGRVTALVDRFEREETTAPALPKPKILKTGSKRSNRQLKKVQFSRIVSRKLVKRYTQKKLKNRRKLILDLSGINRQ